MRTSYPKTTMAFSAIFFISLTSSVFANGNALHSEVPKCAHLDDGFYGEECTGRYFGCANKLTVYVQCPEDLIFDASTQQCDYFNNILACREAKKTPSHHGSSVTSSSIVSKICVGRSNGAYAIDACSHEFLVCSNEVASVSECAADLYYDSRTKVCEHRESVPACNALPSSTAEIVKQSAASGEMVCVGRSNGIISMDCSPKYFVCSNGATYGMSCPEKTVFDKTELNCDYPENVPSCKSSSNTAAFVGVAATTAEIPVSSVSPLIITSGLPTTSEFPTVSVTEAMLAETPASGVLGSSDSIFCLGKSDGNYIRGKCDNSYYACSNQRTNVMDCPRTLVFKGDRCDYLHKVPDCGVTNAPSPLVLSAVSSTTTSPPAANPESEVCAAYGTRYATSECSSDYFECVNGVLVHKYCASEETFDKTLQECISPSPLCSDLTDDSVFDGLPMTCTVGEVRERGQCSTTFFECLETGRFALCSCPEGASFDPAFLKCQHKSYIVDCMPGVDPLEETEAASTIVVPAPKKFGSQPAILLSGQYVGDGFQVPPVSYVNDFYAQPQSMPFYTSYAEDFEGTVPLVGSSVDEDSAIGGEPKSSSTRRIKRDRPAGSGFPFTCKLLPDGTYGLATGCFSRYIKCTNGQTVSMNCSLGLVFHAKKESCDFPSNVPGCKVSHPPHHLLSGINKHVGDISKETMVISQEICRKDGSFGLGCTQHFVLCLSGQATVFTCPDKLVFDNKAKRCVYHERVSGCNVIPEVTTTPSPGIPATVTDLCIGLDDGDYSSPCSAFFVSCFGGKSTRLFCAFGHRYDLAASRCVPAEQCGSAKRGFNVQFQPKPGKECEGKMNGFAAEAPCSQDYFICVEGVPMRQNCPEEEFFSAKTEKCLSHKECEVEAINHVSSVENHVTKSGWCGSKPDGKYRDPEDCNKIVLCFGGEKFSYPSCPSGLVFNEKIAACDYAAQFPECLKEQALGTAQPEPYIREVCKEKLHGTFAKSTACSRQYYRCVWSAAEKMNCPDNTVFNPDLNVCDYKENVASCRKRG